MPWAGNTAKTMTSNRKQFIVTCEMLTAVAHHLSITWLFVLHRFDPFALLCNKSFNDWSLGEQWILFPSNLNVFLNFVSGNIEILGKQNSLFPSGPVIKCLLLPLRVTLLLSDMQQGKRSQLATRSSLYTELLNFKLLSKSAFFLFSPGILGNPFTVIVDKTLHSSA